MKYLLLIFLMAPNAYSQVTYNEFLDLKSALFKAFEELKPSEKDILEINKQVGDSETYWWDLDIVHASYAKTDLKEKTIHNIFLFGGFARLEGMTLDGLAVTACHEIGHGIGGAPFKESGSSMEGQSDYYATKVCLPIVFKYLTETAPYIENTYVQNLCLSHFDYDLCMRMMSSLESDRKFFNLEEEVVLFEKYSTKVATLLNERVDFYPDVQCRLDTMINGVFNKPRPICWYPNGILWER